MKVEKKFNLANDFCYILPQYIVITDHSDPNEILRRKEKDTLVFFLGLISFASMCCLLTGIYFIFVGKDADSYTLFICAFIGFVVSVKWRNRSNIRVIERSQIRNIRLTKVMFNYTFIVLFKNKKGKLNERMLSMKSSNLEEITKAVRIFTEEKLMRTDLQKDFNKVMEEVNKKQGQHTFYDPKLTGQTSNSNQQISKNSHSKSVPQTPNVKVDKRDKDGYVKNY